MNRMLRNVTRWLGLGEAGSAPATEHEEIAAMVYGGDVYPVRVVAQCRVAPRAPRQRPAEPDDVVWPFIR
jgi:hypothetical protein